jgi:hypothetical protein
MCGESAGKTEYSAPRFPFTDDFRTEEQRATNNYVGYAQRVFKAAGSAATALQLSDDPGATTCNLIFGELQTLS